MRPYSEWMSLAKRYDKIVDYGSPMSAWTSEMLTNYRVISRKNHNFAKPITPPESAKDSK